MDYLLLSYVVLPQGLRGPAHIAAGINLNMPVVGSFLRRGGRSSCVAASEQRALLGGSTSTAAS